MQHDKCFDREVHPGFPSRVWIEERRDSRGFQETVAMLENYKTFGFGQIKNRENGVFHTKEGGV